MRSVLVRVQLPGTRHLFALAVIVVLESGFSLQRDLVSEAGGKKTQVLNRPRGLLWEPGSSPLPQIEVSSSLPKSSGS